MILIQNYYIDKNKDRDTELKFCLKKNIENTFIKRIILVVFDSFPKDDIIYNSKKITIIRVNKQRPTYSDLFEIANMFVGIKIITNSDIYFDETLEHCYNIEQKDVYALSRYDLKEINKLQFHDRRDSQDCWIFMDIIKDIKVNYGLGQPGCDNAIAFQFQDKGYNITNPSKTIRAIHVHNSNVKYYCDKEGNLLEGVERVKPPYLRLNIVSL